MSRLSSFDWTVIIARALAVLWGGVWIWYGIASARFEQQDTLGLILHAAVPGSLLALLLVVLWRWEVAGGGLLLLAGAAVSTAVAMYFWGQFPWPVVLAVLLIMVAPPLLAGGLSLAHWRHAHHHG